MRKTDVLQLASSIYTTAYNHACNKISKERADVEVYDAINKFIEKLRKDPGYQGQ